MARRKYPTCFSRWFGKQCIILFGGDKKPVVVRIKGVNRAWCLIAEAINTNETFFPTPMHCIDYSPRVFNSLLIQSKYRRAAGEFEKQKQELLKISPRPNSKCPTEVM